MKKNINNTREILLGCKENMFSLEFAALHYAAPGKNKYAYKMEGLDKNWNEVNDRRFVTYTNIPHGSYVFRVKGTNNDGVWNDVGESLFIEVTPPWWRTNIAYAIYIISFLTFPYSSHSSLKGLWLASIWRATNPDSKSANKESFARFIASSSGIISLISSVRCHGPP